VRCFTVADANETLHSIVMRCQAGAQSSGSEPWGPGSATHREGAASATKQFRFSHAKPDCGACHRARIRATRWLSRHQDHAASPSALAPFVLGLENVPTSRPTFVTMANAPLSGETGRSCQSDLPDGLSEIFLQAGLDRLDIQIADLPVGQIRQHIAAGDATTFTTAGAGRK
jgi:hypothetical protein